MRCKLVEPAVGPNPAFDKKARQNAVKAGQPYDIKPSIELPVGMVIDDPKCWLLCVPGQMNDLPVAVPVDDECRAKVEQHNAGRPSRLRRLRGMALAILEHKRPKERTEADQQVLQCAERYELIGPNAISEAQIDAGGPEPKRSTPAKATSETPAS